MKPPQRAAGLGRLNARTVLSREQALAIGQKILRMTSADTVSIEFVHTTRQITRVANNRVLAGDDGDELRITVVLGVGLKAAVTLRANQVDDTVLHAAVTHAEAVARALPGAPVSLLSQPIGPQTYLPVTLWREGTVAAMLERPPAVPIMIDTAQSAGLLAAGFLGMMMRSALIMNKDGLESYYRETDCECTMTARTLDGTASGWAGQAHRDWTKIDPHDIATTAVATAKQAGGAQALEPGRRTAILSASAVAQLMHLMTSAYDARSTDNGMTPFSELPSGNKIGQQVFDRRVTIGSDPRDPEAGYRPDFFQGLPQPAMTWVEQGVLTNLAYDPYYAMDRGKAYTGVPWSFRVSGGTATVDDMIRSCAEGIYVNRVSSIDLLDPFNGVLTGVTRDGCFLVKNGKIDRPVKNFRFTDSPWFFLNRIVSLGVPVRTALGYTPPAGEGDQDETRWPRRPIIVPPMMVRDFNFNQLADAV